MRTERDRIRGLRQSLSARRQTLTSAKFSFSTTPRSHKQDIHATQQKLEELSGALARARSGLVQELVEVFHVVEVGGRPPLGGRTGTKGEWSIGNLVSPVPGDIRRERFHEFSHRRACRLSFRISPHAY
jgi:hypothetical protein